MISHTDTDTNISCIMSLLYLRRKHKPLTIKAQTKNVMQISKQLRSTYTYVVHAEGYGRTWADKVIRLVR